MAIARADRRGRSHPADLLLASLMLLGPCPGGSPGGLQVLVVDNAGTPVAGVNVDLVGGSLQAITAANGVARLSSLVPGTYTVRATLFGTCVTTASATVSSGTTTPIKITLCPTPQAGDRVTLLNAAGEAALLLADAAVDLGGTATCQTEALIAGTSVIPLGVNALAPGTGPTGGSACHTGLTVFTAGHGAFHTADPAVLAWPSTANDNVKIPLPSRIRVPIAIWVVDPPSSGVVSDLVTTIKTAHLVRASILLGAAGLDLVGNETTGAAPDVVDVNSLPNADVLRQTIGSSCAQVAAIRSQPAIYTAGAINVYYVKSVATVYGSQNGFDCFEEGREIIFVMSDVAFDHILAHELGHALGLVEPAWGHTTKLPGFLLDAVTGTRRNVMASAAEDVLYFSRGQMVRLIFSPDSWLNVVSPGAALTPRVRQQGASVAVWSCSCAPDQVSDDCPPLAATELSSSQLSTGTTLPLACGISVSLAAVSLCVGDYATVTASFRDAPGTGAGPALADEHWWETSNPGVASAIEDDSGFDSSTGGWSQGKIVGVSPGVTEVRARVDGPHAVGKVKVTVLGSGVGGCP